MNVSSLMVKGKEFQMIRVLLPSPFFPVPFSLDSFPILFR
jgi:hypothetical protein